MVNNCKKASRTARAQLKRGPETDENELKQWGQDEELKNSEFRGLEK